jgi:hypothetical protein
VATATKAVVRPAVTASAKGIKPAVSATASAAPTADPGGFIKVRE